MKKKVAGRHREKQWQSIHGRSRIDVAPGFGVSDWENAWKKWMVMNMLYLLGQWLNFKLFGITYLVGKIKFKLFFQGPLAE